MGIAERRWLECWVVFVGKLQKKVHKVLCVEGEIPRGQTQSVEARMRSAFVTDFTSNLELFQLTLTLAHFPTSLPFPFPFIQSRARMPQILISLSPPWPLTRRQRTTTHLLAAGDSSADMLRESKTIHLRRAVAASFFFATVSLSCLVLLGDVDSHRFLSSFHSSYSLSGFTRIFPSVYNDPVAVSFLAPLLSRVTQHFPATVTAQLS